MSTATTLCALALSLWTTEAPQWYEPRIPAMQATCEQVAQAAKDRGEDPSLMISLAWEESRFRWVQSSAGAVGPMQVLPSLWCPGGTEAGCDLIEAGFDAWGEFGVRWPEVEERLCHYNGGNRCGPQSLAYAERIIARWHDLWNHMGESCGC